MPFDLLIIQFMPEISSFYDRQRHKPADFFGNSRIMDHINDIVHVFIGKRRLFRQIPNWAGSNNNTLFFLILF